MSAIKSFYYNRPMYLFIKSSVNNITCVLQIHKHCCLLQVLLCLHQCLQLLIPTTCNVLIASVILSPIQLSVTFHSANNRPAELPENLLATQRLQRASIKELMCVKNKLITTFYCFSFSINLHL